MSCPKKIFLFILLLSSFFNIFLFDYNVDEIEFIHTGWLISKSLIIYGDFFQHHHPLAYFFASKIIEITGETINLLTIFRIICLLISFATIYFVYRICAHIFDKNVAYFSICFLLSSGFFLYAGFRVRADPFYIFFVVFSFYYIYKFIDKKNYFLLVISSFSAAIAFLVLQKALFYFLSVNLFFLTRLIFERNFYIKALFLFNFIFILTFIFGISLMIKVPWNDYIIQNWWVNSHLIRSLSVFNWNEFFKPLLVSPYIFILGFIGIFHKKLRTNKKHWLLIILVLVQCFSMFFVRVVYNHYYVILVIYLSIVSGFYLNELYLKNVIKRTSPLYFFIIITVIFHFTVRGASPSKRIQRLNRIARVMEVTKPDQLVYDGYNMFNLFRYDLDFFWFGIYAKDCLETYQLFKSYSYDLADLIRKKRPALVSSFYLSSKSVEILMSDYDYDAKYDLYILKANRP